MTRNALKEIKLGETISILKMKKFLIRREHILLKLLSMNNYYKITNKNYYLVKPLSNKEKEIYH